MPVRMDMLHRRLQEFGIVDYADRMMILAIVEGDSRETIVAIGQCEINEKMHTEEVALVVKDEYQNMGVGHDLLFISPAWPGGGGGWDLRPMS